MTESKRENYVTVEPYCAGELVCYRFPACTSSDHFTFMYETMFTKLGVKLRFIEFECDVL